jgi:hypothetical protein
MLHRSRRFSSASARLASSPELYKDRYDGSMFLNICLMFLSSVISILTADNAAPSSALHPVIIVWNLVFRNWNFSKR